MKRRVYSVPFADVWRAALAVASSMPGWTIVDRDPKAGRILAESHTQLLKAVAEVEVRLALDDAGLTRVDLTSRVREGRFDFGVTQRRLVRFLLRLESMLRAKPTRSA